MPRKRIPNFNYSDVTINGHKYFKVKYNKPEEVVKALEGAFAMWECQSGTK